MVDEGGGQYYEFDLSRLAREVQRDRNGLPHMASNTSANDNSPGPPIFVPSSKIDQYQQIHSPEFTPILSNGKQLFLNTKGLISTF